MRYQEVDYPPIIVPTPWKSTRKRWEKEGLSQGVDLREYFDLQPFRETRYVVFYTLLCPLFERKVLE